MDRIIRIGNRLRSRRDSHNGWRRGFTMIELMIVMAIVVILISIAVPLYQKALLRAKESVLKNNLFTLRTVIDEYTYDKQKAPQSLQDLVSEGYLRAIPVDPMTKTTDWGLRSNQDDADSTSWGGQNVFDVYTKSIGTALDGTKYSTW